ncbi:unnamed protein product [Larinioides sclopetarius]|uniref:Uncharacterized protein n=1 Tax=Larinioides sclopetarius TaxID=280406 RepID=A0AAV1YXZ3_9ARAC
MCPGLSDKVPGLFILKLSKDRGSLNYRQEDTKKSQGNCRVPLVLKKSVRDQDDSRHDINMELRLVIMPITVLGLISSRKFIFYHLNGLDSALHSYCTYQSENSYLFGEV